MPTNGIVVNDAPGAINGWLRIKSPYLINTHVRGVALHPAVLANIRSGSLKLRFGTQLGIDKDEPTKGYKVVAGTAAWGAPLDTCTVAMADVVGGVFPCFQTSDSPDVLASGKTSIVDQAFMDVETDMVVGGTAPAVGDGLRAQDEADNYSSTIATDAKNFGIYGAFVPVARATLAGTADAGDLAVLSLGIITGVKLNVVNPNADVTASNRLVTVITARLKCSAFGQY